ncbi:MAG: preprotein translocase subunit SecE [Fimbriimonadia bacterium]|nr:preprotein translocase subunit SecE [Fimbriimonadia bacterium]
MSMLKSQTPSSPSPNEGGGLGGRIQRWYREVWAELKKVVKPTPQETTRMTVAVLGIILTFSIWIAILDAILTVITQNLESRFQR